MKAPLRSKIFKIVSLQAGARNVRAFVIGGYVRDFFLTAQYITDGLFIVQIYVNLSYG